MKHDDTSLEDNMNTSENVRGTEPNKESTTDPLSAGESRRRFVKGSLAVAPVLMTVVSRPAWGNLCAPSGMVSGNLSTPGADPADCATGLSPDDYVTHVSSNDKWILSVNWPSTIDSQQKFGDIFLIGENKKLDEILTKTQGGTAAIDKIWEYTPFERAAIAAYANAVSGLTPYLSPSAVQNMVYDIMSGAGYKADSGITWNEADVLAYFMFTWGEGPLV